MTNPKDVTNILRKRDRGVTHYNVYELVLGTEVWEVKTEVYKNKAEAVYNLWLAGQKITGPNPPWIYPPPLGFKPVFWVQRYKKIRYSKQEQRIFYIFYWLSSRFQCYTMCFEVSIPGKNCYNTHIGCQ